MRTITVLMSTYNGKQYLEEQIDSILNQKEVDLKLIIRDDGSTDNTLDIIKRYICKYKNITIIADGINKGVCQSFIELITQNHNTDYYALADQDDIWDPDKLIVAIHMLENKSSLIPLLYYSNLRIVDNNNVFCRLSHGVPCIINNRYSCLSECLPTGCTVVYNRALADKVFNRKPEKCSMHDSWLYLVASMFGKCIYDFEPHINYRQHSGNVIGAAKKWLTFTTIKREIDNIFDYKSQPRFTNAKSFYAIYSEEIDEKTREKICSIINYKESVGSMLKVFLDRDMNSASIHRRFRFKLKLLLHNI